MHYDDIIDDATPIRPTPRDVRPLHAPDYGTAGFPSRDEHRHYFLRVGEHEVRTANTTSTTYEYKCVCGEAVS